MSREQRIQILLRVAEEQGQGASRALAHRRQVLSESHARLAELLGYRKEYARGLVSDAGAWLGVQVQEYWRFMSKLDATISEHRERIDQQAQAVEQSLAHWQDAQRQVAILEKVIERIRRGEHRARERGDQRALDELVRHNPGLFHEV